MKKITAILAVALATMALNSCASVVKPTVADLDDKLVSDISGEAGQEQEQKNEQEPEAIPYKPGKLSGNRYFSDWLEMSITLPDTLVCFDSEEAIAIVGNSEDGKAIEFIAADGDVANYVMLGVEPSDTTEAFPQGYIDSLAESYEAIKGDDVHVSYTDEAVAVTYDEIDFYSFKGVARYADKTVYTTVLMKQVGDKNVLLYINADNSGLVSEVLSGIKKRTVTAPKDGYIRGTVSGNVYTSEWAGVKIAIPKYIGLCDDEYMAKLIGTTTDVVSDDELFYEFAEDNDVYEIYAQSSVIGDAIFVCVEPLPNDGYTTDEYLETLTDEFYSSFDDITCDEPKEVACDGASFTKLDFAIAFDQSELHYSFLVKKIDDKFYSICIASLDKETVEDLLDGISAY